MKQIAGMRWSVWVLGMCVGALAHAQATVGRTAGEASVSATGAARYAIPLVVPPGTNGLAPDLAIVYDHRSGNGLLGAGFRLAGFSAVQRCGRTLAQDGLIGAVGAGHDKSGEIFFKQQVLQGGVGKHNSELLHTGSYE